GIVNGVVKEQLIALPDVDQQLGVADHAVRDDERRLVEQYVTLLDGEGNNAAAGRIHHAQQGLHGERAVVRRDESSLGSVEIGARIQIDVVWRMKLNQIVALAVPNDRAR